MKFSRFVGPRHFCYMEFLLLRIYTFDQASFFAWRLVKQLQSCIPLKFDQLKEHLDILDKEQLVWDMLTIAAILW